MENNNKGIMSLLIVLVVLLTSLCVLFATGTIKFSSSDSNKQSSSTLNNNSANKNSTNDNTENTVDDGQKTNSSYIGEYVYSNTSQETGIEIKVILALANDGTFYIKEMGTMKQYFYGTYEINGDKLVLSYMFRWANDQGNYDRINNEKSELSIQNNSINGSIDYRSNDIVNTYSN